MNTVIDRENVQFILEYINDHYKSLTLLEENIDLDIASLNEEISLRSVEVNEIKIKSDALEKKAQEKGNELLNELTQLQKDFAIVCSKITSPPISHVLALNQNIKADLNKFKNTVNEYEYLLIKDAIESLINEFEAFHPDQYINIKEAWFLKFKALNDIKSDLLAFETPYKNLTAWLQRTLISMETRLYSSYSSTLKLNMELVNWPSFKADQDAIHDTFCKTIGYLILICHLSDSKVIANALEILMEPIRVRFQYHFSGNKSTNRLDKIDWYFHYAIDLLDGQTAFLNKDYFSDHYIEEYINIFTKTFIGNFQKQGEKDTSLEFEMRLAWIFSDYLQESLIFDSLLFEKLNHSPSRGIFIYATQKLPKAIHAWIKLERNKSEQFLMNEVNSNDSWVIRHYQLLEEQGHLEKSFKTPLEKIASIQYPFVSFELFCQLINELLDSYYDIPDPLISYRLFCEVIAPLFSRFFELAQDKILEALEVHDFAFLKHILNSLAYLKEHLQKWDNESFFKQLWQFQETVDTIEDFKPLSEWINKNVAIENDIISKIYGIISHDIFMAFDEYRILDFDTLDSASLVTVSKSMIHFSKYLINIWKVIIKHFQQPISSILNLKFIQFIENLFLNDIMLLKRFSPSGVKRFTTDLDYFHYTFVQHLFTKRYNMLKIDEALVLINFNDLTLVKEMATALNEEFPIKVIEWIKSLNISHLTLLECRKILTLKISSL